MTQRSTLSSSHIPPEACLRVVTKLFGLTEVSMGPSEVGSMVGAVQRRDTKAIPDRFAGLRVEVDAPYIA